MSSIVFSCLNSGHFEFNAQKVGRQFCVVSASRLAVLAQSFPFSNQFSSFFVNVNGFILVSFSCELKRVFVDVV